MVRDTACRRRWLPADPLIHDLTLCARKALRRASVLTRSPEPSRHKKHCTLPTHTPLPAPTTKKVIILDKLNSSPLYALPPRNKEGKLPPRPTRAAQHADPSVETTGPVNWSSDDLRSKYRDEYHREVAWSASQQALEASPYTAPNISRHPLLSRCGAKIESERAECLGKARVRAVSRRFVLDVHQIWLTNLDHFAGTKKRHSKCDHKAIERACSQIQSVSASHHLWRRPAASPRRSAHVHFVDILDAPLPSPSVFPRPPSERIVTICGDRHFFISVQDGACQANIFDPNTATQTSINADSILSGMPRHTKVQGGTAGRVLVYTGLVLVSRAFAGPKVPCCVQIYLLLPRRPADEEACRFRVVAITSSRAVTRRVMRLEITAVHVVAQTRIMHAPLLDLHFWQATAVNRPIWKTFCAELCLKQAGQLIFRTPQQRRTQLIAASLSFVLSQPEARDSPAPPEAHIEARDEMSLSLEVCGHADRVTCVPGTSWDFAKVGLDFVERSSRARCRLFKGGTEAPNTDASRPVAISSAHTKRVVLDLALDCAFLAVQQYAFDHHNNARPPPNVAPLDATAMRVPATRGRKCPADDRPFESLSTLTVSDTIMPLTAAAERLDCLSSSKGRHRRHWNSLSARNFRTKTTVTLLQPDPVLDTTTLCIARASMTASKPSLSGRFMRHSDEACAEDLCRRRTAEDLIYVARSAWHRGANDPALYVVLLNHLAFRALARGGLSAYLDKLNADNVAKAKAQKDARLAAAIACGTAKLREAAQECRAMEPQKKESEPPEPQAPPTRQVIEPCHQEDEDDSFMKATRDALLEDDTLINAIADRLGIAPVDIAPPPVVTVHDDSHPEPPPPVVPVCIPPLFLDEATYASGSWRRLYRDERRSKMMDPRTQGPGEHTTLAPQKGRVVGIVPAASGVEYAHREMVHAMDTIFVTDPIADTVRALQKEHDSSNSSRGGASTDEVSTQEQLLALVEPTRAITDTQHDLEENAILAAKSGDIDKIQEALDQDVFVDHADRHGNTLLILAAQTNNKRMVKTLLRRGANLNAQNAMGNTVLHYCAEYKFDALFEYVLSKGADDELLNSNGRTCYEGIQAQIEE